MEISPALSDKAKRDNELVELAIAGDQRAYAELMDEYKDSIYYMLLKMVNNKIDAEDLTIEAFGKAFKNLKSYTSNYAFSTWLFKIATNNCIDFLRKKKLTKRTVSIDTEKDEETVDYNHLLLSDVPDPEEKMIIRQREKLMQVLVSKLNPRYQELVQMRYFEELSYNEISEKLNLPLGTVKARLFRSRDLLMNILKESGGGLV